MRYLTTKEKPNTSSTSFQYEIADAIYCSDFLIPKLQPFFINEICAKNQSPPLNPTVNHLFNQLVYKQQIGIGERIYNLEVKSNINGYHLKADGGHYQILNHSINAPVKTDATILLGPALILNLAMNNVFCFHASASVINGKVFIFLASSGTGKSTIARFFNEFSNSYRIADDIVAVKIINNQLTILPNFPQLKLNDKQQYSGERIKQKTHFLFINKDNEAKISLTQINHLESMKKLIAHTVATRLFNPLHLEKHLSFCHKLLFLSESYQVSYQHRAHSLFKLKELLDEL